jgi:hypothetical protein
MEGKHDWFLFGRESKSDISRLEEWSVAQWSNLFAKSQ